MLNRPLIPHDVWLSISEWLDARSTVYLSQTCHHIHELLNSRSVWLQLVTRLARTAYLAPHSFPLAELSASELKRIATRPDRIECDILHSAVRVPDTLSSPSTGHDHTPPNTSSLYLHPLGGGGPIGPLELSFGTHARGILYAFDIHTLPGGRWVVAAANAQGNTTLLCCWDTTSPLQGGVLNPVATHQLSEPSGPNPVIVLQHDHLEQRVNILVRQAREYSSVSELELIQLLWSPEERPRFVHRATCPSLEGGPFEGSWRATKTQLDGDIVILTSHGESACLWNWREETWGFIHPDVDYSQLNPIYLSFPYYMRMRADDNSFDVFNIPSLRSCSGPLETIDTTGTHAGRIIIQPPPHVPDFYRASDWKSPNQWYPPNPARECQVVLYYEIHGTPRGTRLALLLHLSPNHVSKSESFSGIGPELNSEPLSAPEADLNDLRRHLGNSIQFQGDLWIDHVQSSPWTFSPSGSFMLIESVGHRDPLADDSLYTFKARLFPEVSTSLSLDRTTRSDQRDDHQGTDFEIQIHWSGRLNVLSPLFRTTEAVAFDIASGRFMHLHVRNSRLGSLFLRAWVSVFQFL